MVIVPGLFCLLFKGIMVPLWRAMGSNSEHNWFMILTGYIMGSNGDRMGHLMGTPSTDWLGCLLIPCQQLTLVYIMYIYNIYSWIVVKFNIYIVIIYIVIIYILRISNLCDPFLRSVALTPKSDVRIMSEILPG